MSEPAEVGPSGCPCAPSAGKLMRQTRKGRRTAAWRSGAIITATTAAITGWVVSGWAASRAGGDRAVQAVRRAVLPTGSPPRIRGAVLPAPAGREAVPDIAAAQPPVAAIRQAVRLR